MVVSLILLYDIQWGVICFFDKCSVCEESSVLQTSKYILCMKGKIPMKRNSSIELLRIISMIFIIISHFTVHGGLNPLAGALTINRIFYTLTILGGLGVDIFIAISGYFYDVDIKPKKILLYYVQIFSFSAIIYICLTLMGKVSVDYATVKNAITPIINETWWFATSYFIIMLLHPALKIFVEKCDRKTFQRLIVIMLIIWSIIPSLCNKAMNGNELHQLIMVYLMGAYMRKYAKDINSSLIFGGLCSMFFLLISYAVVGQYFYLWGDSTIFFLTNPMNLLSRTSLITICMAVSLLYIFTRKNFNVKIVNYFAKGAFGVYLIHDHPAVRPLLWGWINDMSARIMPNGSIPYTLLCVILIYVVCSIITNCLMFVVTEFVNFIYKIFSSFKDEYSDRIGNSTRK